MTYPAITGQDTLKIVINMHQEIERSVELLTTLDTATGDGDHGINLVQGLGKAVEAIGQLNDPLPHDVLRRTGKALINDMGGASGIIIGSFFRGGGRAVMDETQLQPTGIVTFLKAGLAAVQKRGRAAAGDKTLVDALQPAVVAAEKALGNGLPLAEMMVEIAAAAQTGAEETKEMVARFGRAKFLGERSVGHQDAGATSMALMLAAWAEYSRRKAK